MTPARPAPFNCRTARPADTEAVLSLICDAFGLDIDAARPLFYQDPYYDLSLKRLLLTPAQGLVSCLTIIPATLRLGAATVPIAGIAGVATQPECQRRGYASHLLAETNRSFSKNNTPYALTALFPYSEAYYQRLGWTTATRAVRWHGFLPATDPELAINVRPIRPDTDTDRLAIRRLHRNAPPAQTGHTLRDPRRWRILEHLTPTWQWHIHDYRGRITGYAATEPVEGPDPILRVHELIAEDSRARRALIAHLSRLLGTPTFAAWPLAPGAPKTYALPTDNETQLTPEPGMMLRIVNLRLALHELHPNLAPVLAEWGRALTILATDPHLPANERPVRLSAAHVAPDDICEDPWLRADMTTLARLYTGHTLPSEAAALGALTVSAPDILPLADQLFPLRNPHIAPADHF